MKTTPQAVLFDLDNTLLDTHAVFSQKKAELLNVWKLHTDEATVTQMAQDFEALLSEAFGLYTVNPKHLWPHVIAGLAKKYPFFSPLTDRSFEILWCIYTQLPQSFSGATELLQTIKESGTPIGLVTHAEKDWTDFKIDGHGLRGYFDEIIICDVNRPKNASDWKKAIDAFDLGAHEVMVFGDSIPGDILPAHELGVRQLMWVNVSHGWHIYKQGELPHGIIEIRDLRKTPLQAGFAR